MAAILTKLSNTVIAGVALLIILFVVLGLVGVGNASIGDAFGAKEWWAFIFRYLHVLSGVMWVGLLYYFNFVQIPNMPKIPDEQKPAVGKVIAPAALFWFRWAAMATIITGLILAHLTPTTGGLGNALLLGITNSGVSTPIGIGMWLGIIMWFNVWMIIWPNQKRALGIVETDADTKAKSARKAMLFSRTNTLLSIPMLFCMVAQQNDGFVSLVS